MVELRIASTADAGFLFEVYWQTNIGTFESLDPELCETLLQQQSILQETQYEAQQPRLERFVVLKSGIPSGRLYLSRNGREWILVNIAVCPSEQNAGIGTQVLLDLIRDAKAAGCAVRLHVAQSNPAVAWYRRHGFEDVQLKEPYLEMVLNPA